MTARPETLEVRHPEGGEAIVLRCGERRRYWRSADELVEVVEVRDALGSYWHGGARAAGRGRGWHTPRLYDTKVEALDALAVLIDTTPELRHLIPGGAA